MSSGKRVRRSVRSAVWQVPVRLTTGLVLLDSGLGKRGADAETAKQLHSFAAGTYPPVNQVKPQTFVRALSGWELVLGSALLAGPVVPEVAAGAGLAGFAAGLLGLYVRTPGMRREGSLRPTEQGLSLAKDSWMLGIGIALVLDGALHGRR